MHSSGASRREIEEVRLSSLTIETRLHVHFADEGCRSASATERIEAAGRSNETN
jgi:hypothetical protein